MLNYEAICLRFDVQPGRPTELRQRAILMKVVYVSGKFRGPNHWEIEKNIRAAEELSLEVWKLGAVALCPHLNTRCFQGAAPDELWMAGDLELVKRCDAMLMVWNWRDSIGAKTEHVFAHDLKVPIFYKIEDLSYWLGCERLKA